MEIEIKKNNGVYYTICDEGRIDFTPEQVKVIEKYGPGKYDLDVDGSLAWGVKGCYDYPKEPNYFEDITCDIWFDNGVTVELDIEQVDKMYGELNEYLCRINNV